MTITELAKELKLSRQTLYNVINNNGLSIDTLTTVKDGYKKELTAEGIKTICQLVKKRPSKGERNYTALRNKIDTLTAELETVKADKDKLTSELETARADNDKLTAELDTAKRDGEDLKKDIDRLTAEVETVKADKEKLTEELEELKADNSILIKTTATQAVTIQRMKDTPRLGLFASIKQRLTAGKDKGSVQR